MLLGLDPRTGDDGATSVVSMGMEQTRDDFSAGRQAMRSAFLELSDWARRKGFDADEMSRLHGEFFDGSDLARRAFRTSVILASIRS